MSTTLRAGVIGAGVFGRHHAQKYAAMPDVELTAVCDSHPERASAVADPLDATACADPDDLLERVDIVSVASPAASHAALALACLRAGKPVYVEKPLAVDLAEADALIEAARRRGLVLACGFLERAFFARLGLLPGTQPPLRIETERLNPPGRRGLDVSVVLDLMIHDLDIALALSRSEPVSVEAEGDREAARAEVTFENGMVGTFAASRVSPDRLRRATIAYRSGEVEIDFLAHAVRDGASLALVADVFESEAGRDRLGASLAAFVAAVRGEGPPLADGGDGARALDLALAVEQALGQ